MTKKSLELKDTSIKTDLLLLYDEFAIFHNDCSFLCDALACLVAEEDGIDYSTALGASHFSGLIKQRVQKLKCDLKKIHKKACSQNEKST